MNIFRQHIARLPYEVKNNILSYNENFRIRVGIPIAIIPKYDIRYTILLKKRIICMDDYIDIDIRNEYYTLCSYVIIPVHSRKKMILRVFVKMFNYTQVTEITYYFYFYYVNDNNDIYLQTMYFDTIN